MHLCRIKIHGVELELLNSPEGARAVVPVDLDLHGKFGAGLCSGRFENICARETSNPGTDRSLVTDTDGSDGFTLERQAGFDVHLFTWIAINLGESIIGNGEFEGVQQLLVVEIVR